MEWEREAWIEEYQAGESVAEIGRRHLVSRQTVHKWIARYQESGKEGLQALSRAPERHPQAVDGVWRERICALRQEHFRWGAPKLRRLLKERFGDAGVPSESSIGRVLKERGLSVKRRRRARVYGTGGLEAAERPNQVWGIDFKGWRRTGDGQRCEPLTLTDQATRYILCCQSLPSSRTEQVRPVLERVFRDFGLPERMRSDNGSPFASSGACGLTELSVWWIELGIVCERIDPGRPQQNGRHERMHRTLQEATLQPPAVTLRAQQRRFDAFVREFNQQRPHQALHQQVPHALYRASERPYPRRILPPEYPGAWAARTVEDGGRVKVAGQRFFLSHALASKRVGLEPAGEGLWQVWFYRHWLGVWDQAALRLWRPRHVHRVRRLGRRPSPCSSSLQRTEGAVQAQDELATLGLDSASAALTDPEIRAKPDSEGRLS